MDRSAPDLVPTGTEGLDRILHGGVTGNRLHLVVGEPGTGKTTLGLQFVLEGARRGESSLYVTLAESEWEIEAIARSHGWSLDGVVLVAQGFGEGTEEFQTVLHPSEVELPETLAAILDRVEAERPQRLVIDSLSELRTLAGESRWFRRSLLALRNRLAALDCTALLLGSPEISSSAQSLLAGIVVLHRHAPPYGPDRRRLHVDKMRGLEFETGHHDMRIRRGGLAVYPRLVAAQHRRRWDPEQVSTGVPELDALLGGGLDRGASVLFLGPSGAGKTSLATRCIAHAAESGRRSVLYSFDERPQTILQRAEGLGLDLARHEAAGLVEIHHVDPAELTPGEFAETVRERCREGPLDFLVLDTLNAYVYAMPQERLLTLHLHELITYLSSQRVTSILLGTQHGLFREPRTPAELDVSYLADTVLHFRPYVTDGRIHKSVVVYKRRAGASESEVRELLLGPEGIRLGGRGPVGETGWSAIESVRREPGHGPER